MTQLQEHAFTTIVSFHASHGYAPSVREIAESLGKSMAVTHGVLEALKTAGIVTWVPGQNRTLRAVKGAA